MKKVVLLVSLIAVFLVGCQSDIALITVNEEIPSKVSKSVDELLVQMNKTITGLDEEAFTKLCVPGTEIINKIYFKEFIKNEILFMNFFSEKNLQSEANYYITDVSKQGESIPYVTDGYEFRIPNLEGAEGSKFIYIAEGKYNNFDIMLTIIIAENDGHFRIEKFTLGDIRRYGYGIVSLIEKAEKLESKDSMISAWLFNDLAREFISPSPYVYFTDNDLVGNNMVRIADTVPEAFNFPIDVVIEEDTYVQLYAITSNKYDDGFYCQIIYLSNIPENQADETSLKVEVNKLHIAASKIFNGLGEGFDGNILYTAYFEEPKQQGKDYKHITINFEE